MPVIRIGAGATGVLFKSTDRALLIAQIEKELAGETTEQGPVIFEIPLVESDLFDALVVWEKWAELYVPAQIRSEIIKVAYGSRKEQLAQALGVTYREALDDNLLPYAVVPMVRKGEATAEQLREVMLRQGGFLRENGAVDLRFPTQEMAREAHQRLVDDLPRGYWSIVQTAA